MTRLEIKYPRRRWSLDRRDPFDSGVMAYGDSAKEAQRKVKALALHVLADRLERLKKPLPEVVEEAFLVSNTSKRGDEENTSFELPHSKIHDVERPKRRRKRSATI